MKNKLLRLRAGALALSCFLLTIAAPMVTHGQTMNSLNSTSSIIPITQAGMFSWTINGQQEMSQQWYWYSFGPAGVVRPPASIDTLSLVGDSQPTANTLDLSYLGGYPGGTFTLSIDYTLTGSAPGVYRSDMGESISIQNNSATSPLVMSFYKYQDFSLQGGVGANQNTVNIYGNPFGYNTAIQTSPSMMASSDTVVAPDAQEAEAGYQFGTRNKLNNGALPVVLNDVTTAGPGAVTSAFEYDLNIGPGGTALISEDDNIISTVPEPSALALIPSGAAALLLWRKRRQRG